MRVGDTVLRSMSVAEISLVEKMEAEVFVLEAEAAGLAKGKKAEVVIEVAAGPAHRRRGEAGRGGGQAARAQVPTQYFGVILSLARTDPATMKPGQRVRARLRLHDETALVVPRPALFDRDGVWIAHRREPGGSFTAGAGEAGPLHRRPGHHHRRPARRRRRGPARSRQGGGRAGPHRRRPDAQPRRERCMRASDALSCSPSRTCPPAGCAPACPPWA